MLGRYPHGIHRRQHHGTDPGRFRHTARGDQDVSCGPPAAGYRGDRNPRGGDRPASRTARPGARYCRHPARRRSGSDATQPIAGRAFLSHPALVRQGARRFAAGSRAGPWRYPDHDGRLAKCLFPEDPGRPCRGRPAQRRHLFALARRSKPPRHGRNCRSALRAHRRCRCSPAGRKYRSHTDPRHGQYRDRCAADHPGHLARQAAAGRRARCVGKAVRGRIGGRISVRGWNG